MTTTMRIEDQTRQLILDRVTQIHIDARVPDFTIGHPVAPYLRRWFIVRRGARWLDMPLAERMHILEADNPREDDNQPNTYLHRFLRSDDDRALHDHPWPWATLILDGTYIEHLPADPSDPAGPTRAFARHAGEIVIRRDASRPHRVELIDGQPVTTLFFTGGKCREWGFWCKQGWRHWREFTAPGDGD